MQKITPCIWFDSEALTAAKFYAKVFPKSKVGRMMKNDANSVAHTGHKVGSVLFVEATLAGHEFVFLNGGPIFKPNPSVSFFLNFDPSRDKNAKKNLDKMWAKLSKGGKVLMPLQKYPFSEHYGWVEDKYGVSWQLILSDPKGKPRPFIVPSILFTGKVAGKAEEATNFYMKVFKKTKRGTLARYPKGTGADEGTLMFTDFTLEGQWFAAMDSAYPHKFAFSEGVSLMINTKNQKDTDYYYDALLKGGQESQCGWLKDKYGFNWQVSPEELLKYNFSKDKKKASRAMAAMMTMRRIDIKKIRDAYNG